MKRPISTMLCASVLFSLVPMSAEARSDSRNTNTATTNRMPSTGALMYSGSTTLSNGWIQNYSIYADSSTGDVWGDGYVEDPTSIDPTGGTTRWLSYSHYNGDFSVFGSDDGDWVRASFGPDDVTWTQNTEGTWVADIATPNSGPQPLWPVIALAVAVAVTLSGDSGCSCGHNGGTENHPGTNPPEE